MGRHKRVLPMLATPSIPDPDNTIKESVGMTKAVVNMQLSDDNIKKWKYQHFKLFTCILEHIDWTRRGNSNVIELNNRDVAKKMGWQFAEENERKIAQTLRDELEFMWRHSDVALQDPYNNKWFFGHLISCAGGDNYFTQVEISQFFMNHFQGLYQLNQSFPAYMASDMYNFKSSLTHRLFLELRNTGVVGGKINERAFTINELKRILNIENKAYLKNYKDRFTGEIKQKFDHTNFCKRVIIPVLEDISNSETIFIVPYSNGKLYSTIKEKGKITKYQIKFKIYSLKEIETMRKMDLCNIIDTEPEEIKTNNLI